MPGDRVALMLPTGLDFFAAFFGILYAGAVPVPIYPPMQRSQIEEYAAPAGRHPAQCRRPDAHHGAGRARARRAAARPGRDAGVGRERGEPCRPPRPDCPAQSAATARQPRSSSTHPAAPAIPRASCSATPICSPTSARSGRPSRRRSADVFVSWLPLYHDMGLIGAWLGCLYFGAPLYVMSPLALPRAAAKLAVGDPPLSRHDLGGAEFRLRAVPATRSPMRSSQGWISARCASSCNGAEPVSVETLAPVHRALRALRFQAGRDGAGLRACRECGRP